MRKNVLPPPPKTHEGATACRIGAEQELRRTIMSCLLWEDTFYESGVSIAERISTLVAQVDPDKVAAISVEARERMKLRHAPLWLCVGLAKRGKLKAETLAYVIQRADELAEFLALYSDGRTEVKKLNKLSHQARKGLAMAFGKFDEYQLAKYNRDGAVKLRDVLRLVHPKPKDDSQAALWKRLLEGQLATPDTWEVELSASTDKKASWERLLSEKKLFSLALLRNLRNMEKAGIDKSKVAEALAEMRTDRVLPFRFIAAARAVPQWEDIIEPVMLRCLENQDKLPGKTAIVVDNSGSMSSPVSAKSDLDRRDAACALAILIREICDDCLVIGYGTDAAIIPNRRGFALGEAIKAGPGGGTYTQKAIELAASKGYDRIIVITDEQSHQTISGPLRDSKAYFINVGTFQNGIGYGQWTHIDGWSESIIDYIRAAESAE